MLIRCGNRKAHGEGVRHVSLTEVRACFAGEETDYDREQVAIVQADWEAERHIERLLEDRGYEDARAQDAYDQDHGVVDFR